MLGVQQAMQGKAAAPKTEMRKVLVALENIDTGVKLTEDNAIFKEMQKDLIPEGAITKEADFKDRAAKSPLFANDVVTKEKLTEPGVSGKSVLVTKGMRGFAINVDDTHTQSGLLAPGDRVDVLVTYLRPNRSGRTETITKTLLEFVEVLACDNHTASKMEQDKGSNKAKTVSLLLSPEQVTYVLLATRKGTLALAWRNKNDDELVQTKEVDEKLLEELKGTVGINDAMPMAGAFDSELNMPGPAITPVDEVAPVAPPANSAASFLDQQAGSPAPAPQPAKPMWTMKIYNGAAPSEQQFDLPVAADKPAVEGELGLPQGALPKETGNLLKDFFKSALGPGKPAGQKNADLVPSL